MDFSASYGPIKAQRGLMFTARRPVGAAQWVLPDDRDEFRRLEQVIRRTAARVLSDRRAGNHLEDEVVSDVLLSLHQEPADAAIRQMLHLAAFRTARHAARMVQKTRKAGGVEPDILESYPGETDPERRLVCRDLVKHIDQTRMKMPNKERQALDALAGLRDRAEGPASAAERQALRMARRRLIGYEPD